MIATRARDIVAAYAGLVLLSPLMFLIGLLVWVMDGRPILFMQFRSGLHGSRFRVIKFRTMTMPQDMASQPVDAGRSADSQRITALGRWLRFSRFDELPQLWNVLIGEMSLVGPRPLLPTTIAQAGNAALGRSTVRPGLTGWAQISGNALLSDHDKLALDEWYVVNRSHRMDFTIMARTIFVVLSGERIDTLAIRMAHARSIDRRG